MRAKISIALLASITFLAGCNLNLVGQDNNKLLTALTPTYTGGIPNPWYIYADSNGGWGSVIKGAPSFVWNNGASTMDKDHFYQTLLLDFASTQMPHRGTAAFKVSHGEAVNANVWGGGFSFTHTPDFASYAGTPGVDLSSAAFTKCKFMAACPQGRKVTFEAQGVSSGLITLSSTYQLVTINLPVNQTNVKGFFTVNLAAVDITGPMDLYIDDLRYEQ